MSLTDGVEERLEVGCEGIHARVSPACDKKLVGYDAFQYSLSNLDKDGRIDCDAFRRERRPNPESGPTEGFQSSSIVVSPPIVGILKEFIIRPLQDK